MRRDFAVASSKGAGRPRLEVALRVATRPEGAATTQEEERPMKTMAAVALSTLLAASAALAAGPDTEVIARITGLQPEVRNGVAKVSMPRADLAVTVDGVKMQPFQGFTSWAAFTGSGAKAVVMGDMTLAEDEVTSAMDAALGNGLEVTALHNHFSFDRPLILFMLVGGMGGTDN